MTYWTFNHAPDGFIPLHDKGWLLVNVELPDSASAERTNEVMHEVVDIASRTPGVAHTITVSGESFLIGATSLNYGSIFIILDPFEKRKSFDLNGLVIFLHLRKWYPEEVQDAEVSVFPPPPVNGLGATGGFNLMLENRGPDVFETHTEEFVRSGVANLKLAGVMTLYRPHAPEVRVDIDRSQVRSMGVSLTDVSQALEVYLGSVFVNNFNEFGRSWQVNFQADEQFRMRADDIGRLQVRNEQGKWFRWQQLWTNCKVTDIWGRMDWNRPANTLRTCLLKADQLNASGHQTARGCAWTPMAVRRTYKRAKAQ